MAYTNAIRPLGPSYALSVAATSGSVQVQVQGNDQVNYVALQNLGTTTVQVVMHPSNASLAATLTVPGTPAPGWVLPPAMTQPVILAAPVGPANSYYIAAIGSAAGPSLVYITPVGDQS